MTDTTDKTMLIIVDMQKEFINEHTSHIPENIEKLFNRHKFGSIIATVYRNSKSSPAYNILNWDGCMDASEESICRIAKEHAKHIFIKGTYGICLDKLLDFINKNDDNTHCIYIVGVDTDACVLKIALDIFDCGIRPVVIKDCCASSGGKGLHEAAIKILERNIGKENVINSDEIYTNPKEKTVQ